MKLILTIFGKRSEEHFSTKTAAITYAMTQVGLKSNCGHAQCLRNYGYVNFPGNIGSAKIIEYA